MLSWVFKLLMVHIFLPLDSHSVEFILGHVGFVLDKKK